FLMRQGNTAFEFASLGEQVLDVLLAVEILVRLVDIEPRELAFLLGDGRALHEVLVDEGDEDTAERRRAVLLEKILGGIDHDQRADEDHIVELQPGLGRAEEAFHGWTAEQSVEAGLDLLTGPLGLGLDAAAGIESALEEVLDHEGLLFG